MSSQFSVKLNFTSFSNVIDGKCVDLVSGQTRRTLNPATLEENPELPIASHDEVNRAVNAAQRAAKSWAALPWETRRTKLNDFITAFEANSEGFAEMLVREQGKTLNEARGELHISVQFLRSTAALELPQEEEIERTEQRQVVKRYIPLGVAVGIVPWNYPVYLACQRLGQALITGNTFILKPSPLAPYCNLKGTHFFPPGVLQALNGEDSLGPDLISRQEVNVVTFAGSIGTGKKIMESCSKTLKRVILELGGNDPAIVCADVDVAKTASILAYIAFTNAGQVCIVPKRIYVHDSIYDEFLAVMVAYADNLQLSTDDAVAIGPVSNQAQFESVNNLLADINTNMLAVAAGATRNSEDSSLSGLYVQPTIVDNPPDASRVVVEEAFGPVVPVMRWADEDEVIERANKTEYGLGASVWSNDTTQAGRIARQLQAGLLWINTHAELDGKVPGGGIKYSGIGVEGGLDGLKGYCNMQTIWSKLA
ncbi:aldehyde dehydrogenase-like protein [Xylariaceae sp. FL1019]|nr:aldehyde dehydrogenase-like protein [Xylariaceae sp. FL1019]